MRAITILTALIFSCLLTSEVFAKKGALINVEDGVVTPELAISWKKAKDGSYVFLLDTSRQVGKERLTARMVKDSLESKLRDKYGVKVQIESKTVVTVFYNTDETTFLDRIAKTKIKSK